MRTVADTLSIQNPHSFASISFLQTWDRSTVFLSQALGTLSWENIIQLDDTVTNKFKEQLKHKIAFTI